MWHSITQGCGCAFLLIAFLVAFTLFINLSRHVFCRKMSPVAELSKALEFRKRESDRIGIRSIGG